MIVNGQRGVFIPESFVATERGNTLLQAESLSPNLVAWVELVPGVRLEIEIVLANSPALHVGIHTKTEEELAEHIRTNLGGWFCHRCDLESVELQFDGDSVVVAHSPLED